MAAGAAGVAGAAGLVVLPVAPGKLGRHSGAVLGLWPGAVGMTGGSTGAPCNCKVALGCG
jgi:hypothetical protein